MAGRVLISDLRWTLAEETAGSTGVDVAAVRTGASRLTLVVSEGLTTGSC